MYQMEIGWKLETGIDERRKGTKSKIKEGGFAPPFQEKTSSGAA